MTSIGLTGPTVTSAELSAALAATDLDLEDRIAVAEAFTTNGFVAN